VDIRDAKKSGLPPIQFDYKPSPLKIINNGHSIQINYAPGSFITVGDKRYELRQFHFHHPSEEYINGKSYDMVVHLVHSDSQGHLAVVAVLVKKGSANPMIQKLWDDLPRAEGKEQEPPNAEVNAAGLLPEPLGYYTFDGSLTTPPCTEGVTWYVLKTPLEVSAGQIETFAKLYPHNARPIQPSNGRAIAESE
jgi:carbonic anhydrase